MNEIDLGSHEDEFVEAAIFEVDFSKPAQSVDMEKPRFLSDFANSSLFGGFAWLNMTFRNSPTVLRILDQKDLDILTVLREAKNDTTGGWLANDLLNNRLFAEDGFLELVNGGRLVLLRQCLWNFEVTSLPRDRLLLRRLGFRTLGRGLLLVSWCFHGYYPMSRRNLDLAV